MPLVYKALSIAGFDGSGGAGIQADLKTFSALGCYGMTVLTALPVQNTQGVRACHAIPPKIIEQQLEAIFDDIRPDSIKIGMLHNPAVIRLVAKFLRHRASDIPIVLDPVMTAKDGSPLLQEEAIQSLIELLFPLSTLITPNLPEARLLQGAVISAQARNPARNDSPGLALKLQNAGAAQVLVKGGHAQGKDCRDYLLEESGEGTWLSSPRLHSKNTHGTGCTLSSAIAAGLARKLSLKQACTEAREYVYRAIEAAAAGFVGKGCGPVHHFYSWW